MLPWPVPAILDHRACRALHVKQPGTLVVHRHEYLAAITLDRTQWDAITDHDTADADIEILFLRRLLGQDVHDPVENGIVQVRVLDGDRFDLLT